MRERVREGEPEKGSEQAVVHICIERENQIPGELIKTPFD